MMVLSRVPYPLNKGDKLRAYHMLRHICLNHQVYLFCISDQPVPFDVKEHLNSFCAETHFYTLSKYQSLLNCTKAVFQTIPFQAAYFYKKDIHNSICSHAERIKPDVAFFQLIRTAEYATNVAAPVKVLDYMDAFSTGYERMAAKSSTLMHLLYKVESGRLKKYEKTVFSRFNKHLIISEQDKNLIPHDNKNHIQVIHNGVDTGYFSPRQHTQKYDLLFHGNMNYLPNIDCACYIAESIIPALVKRGRKVSFLVSGSSPDKRVLALARNPNITVTGWVDDVRSSYATSTIFIAPLQMGTGIQNKILEAMAMGLPCVVSPLAANALGLIHNEHVLIGNTTEEYCNHIERLWNDKTLKENLVNNALQYTKRNFRWDDETEKVMLYIAN